MRHKNSELSGKGWKRANRNGSSSMHRVKNFYVQFVSLFASMVESLLTDVTLGRREVHWVSNLVNI